MCRGNYSSLAKILLEQSGNISVSNLDYGTVLPLLLPFLSASSQLIVKLLALLDNRVCERTADVEPLPVSGFGLDPFYDFLWGRKAKPIEFIALINIKNGW